MSTVIGRLSGNNDNIVGSGADETIEVPSSNTNLRATDTIDGGAGYDTLLFERTATLGVNFANLAGMSGIEELSFIATPSATVALSTSTILQSDNDMVRLTFDADPVDLDLRSVDFTSAAMVEINGTGIVSLRDAPNQALKIAPGLATSHVVGGTGRDTMTGSGSNDRFEGGAGDDQLVGANGRDVLIGGADQDNLSGGNSDDTLQGDAGYDVLTGGSGVTTASGGTASDTFVVSAGETLTISDFDTTDLMERIDLRGVGGSFTFNDLAITAVGGGVRVTLPGNAASITLTGVSAGDVKAEMFIFPGDTVETVAVALGKTPDFEFSDNADTFVGGAGSDIFEVKGNFAKLNANDSFDGGGGTGDVLRIWGLDRAFSEARAPNMSRVEIIDMSGATGALEAQITQAMVDSSDSGTITVRHGSNDITMLTGLVADAADVIVEGSGAVTLRDVEGQGVKVSDFYAGTVTGQSKNDVIIGGALSDTLDGAAGHDSLSGGLGADRLIGFDDRDTLSGGNGADTLLGGRDEDELFGGSGDDSLDGGNGFDVLTGGTGANIVKGGAQSDTFIVTSGENLTITDFDAADLHERIDLRGLGGSFGFDDLTLTPSGGSTIVTLPGGAGTITLSGVSVANVTAEAFLFPGNTMETLAVALGKTPDFEFTDAADLFVGGAGDQVFEVKGNFGKLSNADTFDGGAGEGDVLRIWGNDRAFSDARAANMSRVEIIDMSGATGALEAQLWQGLVDSSDSGKITVKHGSNDIIMLTGMVDEASSVVMEGTGTVTLRDVDGQGVTVSDFFDGHVVGQNKNDVIFGGARNDTLEGSGGDDRLDGGAGGDDLLVGGDGNDTLTSQGGMDTLTGGAGTDRFVVSNIANGNHTIQITDFQGSALFESIDLRDWGVSFADLTLTQNGTSADVGLADGRVIVRLDNYQTSALGDDDFITFGEAAPEQYVLSAGADTIIGGDADDLFDLVGQISQLDNTIDSIDGGGGFDTLRVFGADRSLGPPRLEALHSIEAIDLTAATGNHDIAFNNDLVSQSDTGSMLIKFGDANLNVNSGGLLNPNQLVLEGSGLVTLSSGTLGQMVTISNAQGGNIQSGNDATIIIGGSKADTIRGDFGDDTLKGNSGADSITGGEGNDELTSGRGADTLRGGEGNDLLIASGGANVLDGGAGFDQYVIKPNSEGTVIEDFDPGSFIERIDLTAIPSKASVADLTFTQEGADARVTGSGLDLLLKNVNADDLSAANFLFNGQDPLLFQVVAGTTTQQFQDLFDGAPKGAVIEIEAGTYSITKTLLINRGDITVKGAGDGQTIFQTDIPNTDAGQTILVQPDDLADRYGFIAADAVEGTTTVQLPDYEALRAADPTQDFEPFEVGDLVYLMQANDPEWIAASGNELWNQPVTDDPLEAELYYLRETRSRIVSIDENGVATLAEALPYTFEAGKAQILKNTFLSNVQLSDFSIVGNFGPDPDPFFFENTIEEWTSIAALELDGVRDSHIENISITNPAAHAFKWQRSHETTGDNLTATGAHNKSGSSGYHFYLQESFANTFTNLTSVAARHAFLTSSYSAEHYNNLHFLFTDRDMNFHGSPDDENTIVIDQMVQNYPLGITDETPQWQSVHPGVTGLHPASDIEGNDVTFKYLRAGERSDRVVAHVEGGNIATNVGSDHIIGQGGNDTVKGDDGNDLVQGFGGDDILNGNDGKDTIEGGDGNDTLRGGDDNDIIYGGDGDDVVNGGANGDNLFGGAGSDIFLRIYEDFTDQYMDFEPGAGGDVMLIRGSAYSKFSELLLRQAGDDVILDFGPTGFTTFRNTQLTDLTADNFRFIDDGAPGSVQSLKATELRVVGTNKSDTFNVSRAHMDSPDFHVIAGGGYDKVVVTQSSLNANLADTGTYSGVEEFDLSAIDRIGITVENPLVSQSSSGKLYINVGDADAGFPVLLDVGPLGRGKNVFIVGGREVQLTGGREHVVKSGDDIGVNIIGDDLRDVIFGSKVDDVINGGAGNDIIFGAGGVDTLRGGEGNDTLNGGPGSDIIYIDDAGDRVAESRRWDGEDHVIAAVDFRMGSAHIETLELTGTARLGAGNGLMNTITGNDGDNLLDGGKNVDTLIGGLGNDTYLLRAPGDNAVEEVDGGIDTVRAFRTITLDANVENLFIQTLRNKAGEGIAGVSGYGNELDNLIIGNPFDNTLGGGEGNDTLRGQAGADRFLFNSAVTAENVDRVIDFSQADGDRIMLEDDIFAGMARGVMNAVHFAAGTEAETAGQFVIYDQASGQLWYDADGNGAGEKQLVATFDGTPVIDADDFLIF